MMWSNTLFLTWVSVTSCHVTYFLSHDLYFSYVLCVTHSCHVTHFLSCDYTGSRMQKYWFKVTPKAGGETHLVTIAPVSPRCPIKLDFTRIDAINKLVRALQVCEGV